MPELHFSFSIHAAFLIFSALSSVALAAFVYRFTVPPVSFSKQIGLIGLRSLGLFLLFLLIMEPLLTLVTHSVERPIIAVLADNSESMAIHDRAGRRDEKLKSILRSNIWQQIAKDGNLMYSVFDEKIRVVAGFTADSCLLRGEATDIAEALKSIKQISASSNLQAAVLVTDGNSTVGMNPLYEAEELGVPIFTIGVGDTNEQKDILVRSVLTNEIAYIGTRVPVNVKVHSAGFGGERVQVSLVDGAATLDEKMVTLEHGARDYLIPLSFIPDKEGMQKFTVGISVLPDELTTRNNRLSFFIKVLKSKLRIVMIAGAPSQDVASIRHALMNDKNIELKSFIERIDGQFYENSPTAQVLQETDCLVLIGFPMTQSTQHSLHMVIDAVNAGKPLLTVLSRTIDYNKLHILEPVLPFYVESVLSNEIQIFTVVLEEQRNNPLLRIGNAVNTIELWSKFPPVFRTQGVFRSKVESEILASVRSQPGRLVDPLIVARNVNKRKSLSVLGYGLWRWNMLSDAGSGTAQALDIFMSNATRWLTTIEDERRIRVQPLKHIYTTQDAVEFAAQVYDENYQPVDNALVEINTQHGNETSNLTLNALGSGQYQGAYDNLQEGEFKFTATVTVNGTKIGSDKGSFSVGGLNAEYLETQMNRTLLQQIAVQTGGRYYDSDDISSLPHDIVVSPNFKTRDMVKSTEIEIWNSRWMLAFIVMIFAIEWLIRKRNGML